LDSFGFARENFPQFDSDPRYHENMPRHDFSHRHRTPEVMDDPSLDAQSHRNALRGLSRVARISGTVGSFWSHIRPRATKPLRVLDVACGGGDLVIGLTKSAAKERLPIEVVGCDISRVALEFAREQAIGTSATFFPLDIFREPIPTGFDVVTCSLFLHHLDDETVVTLLRNIRESGVSLFLASDLRRGRFAYLLTWVMTRILSRSEIVHIDGPLSVKAAFTLPEMRTIADAAGLSSATIRPIWPFRFLLKWEHPS